MSLVRPRKSTNVRIRQLRTAGLKLLAPHAPTLAARWAEHLFTTAPRHRRPAWEEFALSQAEREDLLHDGASVPLWTWGGGRDAPAIVLVHGWEGRGSQLAAFVPPLLEAGYRVVTFDAPGHGEATARHASLVTHARALVAVSRAVGPVHAVVGHSVGGAAALLATRFGLQADQLALVAPPASPARFAEGFARAYELDDTLRLALIARLEARYRLPFDSLDVRIDAARTQKPLLVVHDEGDAVVALSDGAALASASPNGRLVVTKGLGHRRILKAPEVVRAVADFVGTRAPTFGETLEGELYFRWSRAG